MENLETLIVYADKMYEYSNANTELLLREFFKLTEKPLDINKMSEYEIAESKIGASIQKAELEIYQSGLLKLYQESTLRAVALETLFAKEQKRKIDFLGIFSKAERLKRNNQLERLQDAVQRMKISKKIIEQQIQATNNAMQGESIIATNLSIYDTIKNIDKNITQEILKKKIISMKEMAEIVIPEYAKELNAINLHSSLDEEEAIRVLAKVQRKLDVYAYTHRKDIPKLKQELKELTENVKEIKDHAETLENRERLLEKINRLQLMYKIFDYYISKEDKQKIYEVKFDILTLNLYNLGESPFVSIEEDEERNFYAMIIEKKIEKILKGENAIFKGEFINLNSAIDKVKKIFKAENDGFSAHRILYNYKLLSFLLSFDERFGFNEFLKLKLFSEHDLLNSLDIHQEGIVWEKTLPLRTIYILEYLADNLKNKQISTWVKLCNETRYTRDMLMYGWYSHKLPEGIVLLGKDLTNNVYSRAIERLICEKAEGKIECPSTLKEIHYHFPRSLKDIYLNEGLECIGTDVFSRCQLKDIVFPGSLQRIGERAFCFCEELEKVEFNEGLKYIDAGAFKNTALRKVICPSTLFMIGEETFCDCINLEEIVLNNGLEYVGTKAFYNSDSLRRLSVPTSNISFNYTSTSEDKTFDRDYLIFLNGKKQKTKREITLQVRGMKIPYSVLSEFGFVVTYMEEVYHDFMGGKLRMARENMINKELRKVEFYAGDKLALSCLLKDAETYKFDGIIRYLVRELDQVKNELNIY